MFMWFIIGGFILLCIPAFIDGYTGNYRFAKYYGVEINPDETSETDEINDIHKQERIEILDNTLVQYNKLLDSLADQLRNETIEKERVKLLTKQIATLEKYNRALEKREKLE